MPQRVGDHLGRPHCRQRHEHFGAPGRQPLERGEPDPQHAVVELDLRHHNHPSLSYLL
jgi:hypothetical protein